MKNQIERAVREYEMFSPGDNIVVGLSGGADSVALTHFLRFVMGMDIVACHLNHCLRGKESERDLDFVRRLCEEWKIPLFCKTEDIIKKAAVEKLSLETAGRRARYCFFEEVRFREGACKIATAHTLSDSVETMVFSLVRGTAHKGLCGIPPVRGLVVRPLIYCTREEVEDYCRDNGLSFVTDSTNEDDSYSRNKIRRRVIPVLKEINPSFEKNAGRTMETLRKEEEYLNLAAQKVIGESRRGSSRYLLAPLNGCHPAIRDRAVSLLLTQNHIPQENRLIQKIEKIIQKESGKWEAPGGHMIEAKGESLFLFIPEKEAPYFEKEVFLGDSFSYLGKDYDITLCSAADYFADKKVYKKLLYLGLNYDKIKGKLYLRQRKPGDRIALSHRNGTKTLKKLFNEAGLTQREKSETPVFCDEEGVVGILGFGADRRCAVTASSQQVLRIKIKE